MGDNSSGDESEVKEVKIADIKDKLIQEEKETYLLKRKKERKDNKKKRRSELLKKYQEELNEGINEEKIKMENLVAKKKVKNDVDKIKNKKVYVKKNVKILIQNKNATYNSIPKEVLDFKNQHFYGGRIEREKNFLGKI